MFKKIALLLALAMATVTVAQAGTIEEILDRGTLRVGMEPGYMPFEMTNQKGEIIGFDVDVVKRMAKAMGVKLELVSTAWDGIIPSLLTKKFDLIASGMTVTQGRDLKVNFATPYIVVGQTILIKKELAGEIKSYKDLKELLFAVDSDEEGEDEEVVEEAPTRRSRASKVVEEVVEVVEEVVEKVGEIVEDVAEVVEKVEDAFDSDEDWD